MKFLTLLSSALCILFLILASAHSQTYYLSTPDTTVLNNYQQVSIPVIFESIDSLNKITSYDIELGWDTTVLEFSEYSRTGTLTESWKNFLSNDMPGKIFFGAYSDSFSTFPSKGILINLIFNIIGKPLESTAINWLSSTINAVIPNMKNGIVSIAGYKLEIMIQPVSTGTVVVEPDLVEYAENDSVRLTAKAAEKYKFDRWSGSIDNIENPAIILMNDNKFITAHFVPITEEISTPGIPQGPISGKMGKVYYFFTSGSTSNLNHKVEYQFDWGDDTLSVWGDSVQQHVYETTGNMSIKVRARCKEHANVMSQWSDAHPIEITGYYVITNIEPTAAGTIIINPVRDSYAYGDTLILSAVASHFYKFVNWNGDIFGNQNPEKLYIDTNKVVTAYFEEVDEFVTTPVILSGVSEGFRKQLLNFSVGNSQSNLGSIVEYQFDWGDGCYSDWGISNNGNSTSGLDKSHAFLKSGRYDIKARARSTLDSSIISEWSENLSVNISGCNLTINILPDKTYGNVEKVPDYEDYDYDAEVIITAIPNANYSFINWNNNAADTAQMKKITLVDNVNLIANFDAYTGIKNENTNNKPDSYKLLQNYPNPFNPSTTIGFRIPKSSHVSIKVFDLLGREVEILVSGFYKKGEYQMNWSPKNIPYGLYFYRLDAGEYSETKKIIVNSNLISNQ